MKLGYKIKPRDAKSNPTTAILAAVFVMFLIGFFVFGRAVKLNEDKGDY